MRAIIPTVLLVLTATAALAAGKPVLILGEDSAPPAMALAQAAPAASQSATPAAAAAAPAATSAAPAPAQKPAGTLLYNFPQAAITQVGANTMGQGLDVPATPPSPDSPAPPPPAGSGPTPPTPNSPTPPANPISKLWPRDTVQLFMPSCTGLRPQFVVPCGCVIGKLMTQMPHDEFLAKSEAGTIEQDPRLIQIRTDCATAPQKKD